MNDTAKQVEAEPEAPENEAEVVVELTPAELEAKDAGWNPEKTDKDGNSLSAKEFMARKPLFNKIHNMRDDITGLRGDMKKMTQFFIEEKAKSEAQHVAELKAAREEALTNLDVEGVRSLDKQIETASETKQQNKQTTNADWEKPYMAFVKDNAWYGTNPALKSVADIIGKQYAESNPDSTPEKLYEHIANEMKKDYPIDTQGNNDTPNGSKVSGSTRRASTRQQKKQVSLSDLSPEDQQTAKIMAESTGKPIEEFLKNIDFSN
jgi:hypothetical protein